MQNFFEDLLAKGVVIKHHSFDYSGIVCGHLRKVSGSAGVDVNYFYYDPSENKIDVCYDNTHYGYAHINKDGYVQDDSNRSIFEIVK